MGTGLEMAQATIPPGNGGGGGLDREGGFGFNVGVCWVPGGRAGFAQRPEHCGGCWLRVLSISVRAAGLPLHWQRQPKGSGGG